jgi:hypothetical protein
MSQALNHPWHILCHINSASHLGRHHPGKLRYHKIIQRNAVGFKTSFNCTEFLDHVISIIEADGAVKFLLKTEENWWVEMPHKQKC